MAGFNINDLLNGKSKAQAQGPAEGQQALLVSQIPEYFEELVVSVCFFFPLLKSSVSLQTKQIESVGHRERINMEPTGL